MISRGRFELTVIARGITSGRLRNDNGDKVKIGTSGIHHVFCSNDDSHQIISNPDYPCDCIHRFVHVIHTIPYYPSQNHCWLPRSTAVPDAAMEIAKWGAGPKGCNDRGYLLASSLVSTIQHFWRDIHGYSIWLHMATYGYYIWFCIIMHL